MAFRVKYLGEDRINFDYGKIYDVKFIVDTMYCIQDEMGDESLWVPDPDDFEIVEGGPEDVEEYLLDLTDEEADEIYEKRKAELQERQIKE